MQPFDLSIWLKDKSRKIVTRDGKPVRIVCWDKLGDYPIIGCIKYSDNCEDFETYNIDGSKYSFNRKDQNDLFFADEEENLSENERIRKELLDYLKRFIPHHDTDLVTKSKGWIAWLEKQKPVDMIEPKFKPGDNIIEKDLNECGSGKIKEIKNNKYYFTDGTYIDIQEQDLWQLVKEHVEPKFKVGDWIVKQYVSSPYVIVDIKNNLYILNDIEGNKYEETIDFVHNRFHLWTIEDAKDGDVLAEHETIVLFKKIEGQNIRCYCTYHYLGFNPTFYVGTLQYKSPYCPATKEQRDLLLQKMKEIGYEWDAEKKELRTIEQESTWNEKIKGLNELETYILSLVPDRSLDAIKVDAKNIRYIINKEQKPSWSEEDKEMLNRLIGVLEGTNNEDYHEAWELKFLPWLKSLKPQSKQEWSEEDERMLKDIISGLEATKTFVYAHDKQGKAQMQERIDWLKSIKTQPHWKPSEEQMKWLKDVIETVPMTCRQQIPLESLYNDLKKL